MSYDPSEARDRQGKWTSGGGADPASKARAARALATYKPSTSAKQKIAADSERSVSKMLGGEPLPDNEPMDIVIKSKGKTIGVEVKTFVDNKNDKVTMHTESLARKTEWARKNRANVFTVVVDRRGSKPALYFRAGVGSFRLANLMPIRDAAHLRQMIGL